MAQSVGYASIAGKATTNVPLIFHPFQSAQIALHDGESSLHESFKAREPLR